MPSFDPWHTERLDATLAFWRFAQNPRVSPAAQIRRPKPTPRSLEAAFMLWALDLRRDGASLREVAELLLGPMPRDWDDTDQRSFTRRLVARAKAMTAGGYRLLLKPRRRIAR